MIDRTSTDAAISSAVIFAMGTLLTPCKDSEGTAHVAASIIAQYANVCSIVLLKEDSFLSD